MSIDVNLFYINKLFLDSPILRLAKQIETSPLAQLAKQIETSPFAQLAKQIEISPFAQLAKQIEISPFAQLAKQIEISPFAQLAKQIEASPISQYILQAEQISSKSFTAAYSNPTTNNILKTLDNISTQQKQMFRDLNWEDTIHSLIGDQELEIDISEEDIGDASNLIEKEIDELTQTESLSNNQLQINDFLYSILIRISNQLDELENDIATSTAKHKHSVLKWITDKIIIPFIITLIITTFSTSNSEIYNINLMIINNHLSQQNHENDTKTTRKLFNLLITPSQFRVVDVEGHLNVRARPSLSNSGIIGKLKPLSIVKVIKKSKGWRFIVYTDYESGSQISGWVFSKFLKKF